MTLALTPAVAVRPDARPYGIGQPGARLLAGPTRSAGPERLAHHLARLGYVAVDDPERLLEEAERSGLRGRGGGGFPAARKLAAGRRAGAPSAPRLVVNASESEPASVKDRTLCALRPHMVLDGAAVAAWITGATEVVLYLHRGADEAAEALREAAAERQAAGLADPSWYLGAGPARYVAGEASAIASWLEGGEAKPRALRLPLATAGVSGRPTVVHNVETLAHLGLIARYGAEWWRQAGTAGSPGSRLVTVHRGDRRAPTVVEVVEPVAVGSLLRHDQSWADPAPPSSAGPGAAVLVGGYAGRWAATGDVERVPFSSEGLATAGLAPGCGLLAPLPPGACGVAAVAALTGWLAAESAGQCGPCLLGLADVAEALQRLVQRSSSRREVRSLRRLLDEIRGKGACHHPDGVVGMVESGLDVFADEVDRHARGRRCHATAPVPAWPLPLPDEVWR